MDWPQNTMRSFLSSLETNESFWPIRINGNLVYLREGGMCRATTNEPKFRCLRGKLFRHDPTFNLREMTFSPYITQFELTLFRF